MKYYSKNAVYGILTWLLPFATSLFFYSKDGVLAIDLRFFKSIMIVVDALAGAVLLALYFKGESDGYLQKEVAIGLAWLALNLVLDFLILIPMSHLSTVDYISQIGFRYLTTPIMSIAMGCILARREKNS